MPYDSFDSQLFAVRLVGGWGFCAAIIVGVLMVVLLYLLFEKVRPVRNWLDKKEKRLECCLGVLFLISITAEFTAGKCFGHLWIGQFLFALLVPTFIFLLATSTRRCKRQDDEEEREWQARQCQLRQ